MENIEKFKLDAITTKPINLVELFTIMVKYIKPMQRKINYIQEVQTTDYNFEEYLTRFKIEKALERVAGKKQVYADILIRYMTNYKEFKKNIEEEFANYDFDTIKRIIHTLKGASGNIGATETSGYAKEFESILSKGKNALKELCYSKMLNSISLDIKEIKFFSEKIEVANEKDDDTIETEDLVGKVKKLIGYLDGFDTQAEFVIAEIAGSLKNINIQNVDELIMHIKLYEHEKAKEQAEVILAALENNI